MALEFDHFPGSHARNFSFDSSVGSSSSTLLHGAINTSRSSSGDGSSYNSDSNRSNSDGFYDDGGFLDRYDSSSPPDDDDQLSPGDSLSSSPILGIPFPVFLHICSFLSEDDYLTLLEVSRFFYRAITEADPVVWKALCFEKWKNRQGCHNLIVFCHQLEKERAKSEQRIAALTQRLLLEGTLVDSSGVEHPRTVSLGHKLYSEYASENSFSLESVLSTSAGATSNPRTTVNMEVNSPAWDEVSHITADSVIRKKGLLPPSALALCSHRNELRHRIVLQNGDSRALHFVLPPGTASFRCGFSSDSHFGSCTGENSLFYSGERSESRSSNRGRSRSISCENSHTCCSTAPENPLLQSVEIKDSPLPHNRRKKEKNTLSLEEKRLLFHTSHNRSLHRKRHRRRNSHRRGLRRARRHKKKHTYQRHKHRHRTKAHHKRRRKGHAPSHQKCNPKMSKSARRRRRHQRSKQRALQQLQQPVEPTATLNAIHSTTPSIPLSELDPLPLFPLPYRRENRDPNVELDRTPARPIAEEVLLSETPSVSTYWWDLTPELRALHLSRQQRIQEQARKGAKQKERQDRDMNAAGSGLDDGDTDNDDCEAHCSVGKLTSFENGGSCIRNESDCSPPPYCTPSAEADRTDSNGVRVRRLPPGEPGEEPVTNKGCRRGKDEDSRRVRFSSLRLTAENGVTQTLNSLSQSDGVARASAHPSTPSSRIHKDEESNTSRCRHRCSCVRARDWSDAYVSPPHSLNVGVLREYNILEEKIRIARSRAASTLGIAHPHAPRMAVPSGTSRSSTIVLGEGEVGVLCCGTSASCPPSFPGSLPPASLSSASLPVPTSHSRLAPVSLHGSISAPLHSSFSCSPFSAAVKDCLGETSAVLAVSPKEGMTSCPCANPSSTTSSSLSFQMIHPTHTRWGAESAIVGSSTSCDATRKGTGCTSWSSACSSLSHGKGENSNGVCSFPRQNGSQEAEKGNEEAEGEVRYECISWKFAYYMSRREARRRTITLHDLLKGLWLACDGSTGRCHPVRFLESHQMELFPPLYELEEKAVDRSHTLQRNLGATDARQEHQNDDGSSSGQPITGDESRSTAARSPAPFSREEVTYSPDSPILTKSFYIMQSGGALVLVPHHCGCSKPFTVHHRSLLANGGCYSKGISTRRNHLPGEVPLASGGQCMDPLERFNAEPNYSVARLRRAAENLVMSEESQGNLSPSCFGVASHSTVPCTEFPPSEDSQWKSKQPLSLNSAIRVLFGWETSKRRSLHPSHWLPPTVSMLDQNAVDDDWGWTISNDTIKIFSVDVSRPLYIEKLEEVCAQTTKML